METKRLSGHASRHFGNRVNLSGKLSSAQCLCTSGNTLRENSILEQQLSRFSKNRHFISCYSINTLYVLEQTTMI